ncbi:MAG: TonB-dependent receptor, partial [bacterium]
MLSRNRNVTLRLILLLLATVAGAEAATVSADSLANFVVAGGDTIWLTEPVEVVGSRVPAVLPGVLRSVSILDLETAARPPGRSVAELLTQTPGVVVNQRQQYGVQGDLTIRGSSYEQVQVLLDGIDIGDPQTGHHLLNLPLGFNDISRLEVLRGHGSSLYGANAFGGTVNVVSRRPVVDAAQLAVTGGGNGTWGARGAVAWGGGENDTGPRTRLSLERFRSDGDRPDYETDNWAATARLQQAAAGGEGDLFLGYSRRAFGAPDFYSPTAAWERTEALFGAVRWRRDVSVGMTIEPRLHFRRHEDRFILLRDNPDYYTNDHLTRRGGAEIRAILQVSDGTALVTGLEAVYEDINSVGIRGGAPVVALGDQQRRRGSLALELARNRTPLHWQLGLRLDTRSNNRPRLSRSLALAYTATPIITVRGSAGTTFRIPTFTELNYVSDSNLGDPALFPERGWAWDVGLDTSTGPLTGSLSFFERHEYDLIDWVRPRTADQNIPWQARNIATGRTRGTETALVWLAPRRWVVRLSYSHLHKVNELPADQVGKYTLLAPRHVLNSSVSLPIHRQLQLTLSGRYLERTGEDADFAFVFVADGRLRWQLAPWSMCVQVTNLLDRMYQDVPGVPMPGRLAT